MAVTVQGKKMSKIQCDLRQLLTLTVNISGKLRDVDNM